MGSPLLLAALWACKPPAVSVVSAEDRGPLPTQERIQGRDGGYSALVDGMSVWAHGDTILAGEGEAGAWLNSSVSWTADLDATDGITGFTEALDATGTPAQFFPPSEDVFWAGALVADPLRGGALVAWIKLGEDGSEATGIAHWPGPGSVPSTPQEIFGSEPRVNSALVPLDDRLYGVGCRSDGGFGKPCILGRVGFEEVDDPSAWRFWTGKEWSEAHTDATPLFSGHDITSVHFSEPAGLWIAVYSAPLGQEVLLRTSPELTGPWSRPVELFEARLSDDGALPYSAVAHAEYAYPNASGWTEVITYHRGTEPWHSELRVVHVELE